MSEELKMLVDSILEWWELHEFDVDGEYGDFNVYSETPVFVQIAIYLKEKNKNE